MVRSSRLRLAVLLCPLLSGCGAGLISGVIAGSGSANGSGKTPAPSAAMFSSTAPLVGTPRIHQIVLNNYRIPKAPAITVEMRGLGMVIPQEFPVVVGTNPTPSIAFIENHTKILNALSPAALTAADVPVTVHLLINGHQIAGAIPFTLIRQRTTRLEPATLTRRNLSVLGNQTLAVRVAGRAGETELDSVRMQFVLPDGSVTAVNVDAADVVHDPMTGDWVVSAAVPPNRYPAPLAVSVQDDLAGFSELLNNVYYQPAVVAAAPRFGSSTGGSLMAVIGQGLAPLLSPTDPNTPDFSKVTVVFHKGGRDLQVPQNLVRSALSSLSQLVFTLPQSPDGRPGSADVEVQVDLAGVTVSDVAHDLVTYQTAAPGFGPRGALLASPTKAVALASVLGAATAPADLLALTAVGGVPRVELLAADGNGMFSSFGPPIDAATQADQREPVAICSGDFDGDGDSDVWITNSGSATSAAHSILLADGIPKPPLRLSSVAPPDDPGAALCRVGDFTGDKLPDVLVVPGPTVARAPSLFVSDSTVPPSSRPSYQRVVVGGALAAAGGFEACSVADVDGDGALDVVCANGGTDPVVVVAYGDGTGAFPQDETLALQVPGWTPSMASPAIGVHVLSGGTLPRPIAVVMAGESTSPATPPAVIVLPPGTMPRSHGQPGPQSVLTFTGAPPLVASTIGDLGPGFGEVLAVAGADGSSPILHLLHYSASQLTEFAGAVPSLIEPIESVKWLSIGPAVPAGFPHASTARPALFMRHDIPTSGGREPRITTWLADPTPRLLPPDGSIEIAAPIEAVALGSFLYPALPSSGPKNAQDVMVLAGGELHLMANDGLGTLTEMQTFATPGVVSDTLARANAYPGLADAVVYLTQSGALGVVQGAQSAPVLTSDLRQLGSAPVASWDVSSDSQVLATDVDGDNLVDLLVTLVLDDPASPARHTLILMLRGIPAKPGALPFALPDGPGRVAEVQLGAGAATLGQFAGGTPSPELAVTFPGDGSGAGNYVRFYRYQPGAAVGQDSYVPSFTDPNQQVLLAGDQPTQIVSADLDKTDTADLVVASAGDGTLRFFLNTNNAATTEVSVGSFAEATSAPSLPPGKPAALLQGDLNGDGIPDLVTVTTESTPLLAQHFAVFVSTGAGTLTMLRLLPDVRTGNQVVVGGVAQLRDAEVHSGMADLNQDGVPDLVLGWGTAGGGDRNLRVLFGGTR